MMQDYLKQLNTVQREAVNYLDGPSLIVAGAGSGKTRVLTYKIVHLMHSGFDPKSILALTFTNKAAREMKERMSKLSDHNSIKKLWMGTFHSIFAKILRVEGHELGFPSTFSIYDSDDSKREIKEIIKELKLDDKQYPPAQIFGRISNAKNNLMLPVAYNSNIDIQKQDIAMKRPFTAKIYKMYFDRCRKATAMDFDDLLLNTNILFRDFPHVLDKYQNIFKFILVDEYQDTNYAQYLIVKKISEKHKKICVVGDDSQSIYSFRGAKIENILNFKKDFVSHKLFKLEQNYRSTSNIVNAANSLIEKNKNRIPKVVFTDNESGDKVKILEIENDKREASYVARSIREIMRNNNFDYNDFAILYRTNAQSRSFEDALRRLSIPYRLFGSISFYQRAEIKNVVAYLRLIVNKRDDQALKRIINYPKRNIGNTTVEKIINVANSNELNVWDVILQAEKLSEILTGRTITSIVKFRTLIQTLTNDYKQLDPIALINTVVEKTRIKQTMAEDKSSEGISKYENIQELINGVQDYFRGKEKAGEEVSIENFLEEIALITDQDQENEQADDKVNLMTIHASKGLEYKCVYIVGVEEGLFPSYRSITNPKDIEEERRLFYVAITRSEKILNICFAKQRMKWGKIAQTAPSRFIKEIGTEFIDFDISDANSDNFFDNQRNYDNFANSNETLSQKTSLKTSYNINDKPKNLVSFGERSHTEPQKIKKKDEKTGLKVGMKVNHSKFGIGKIITIEGDYPNTKAEIDFENAGNKKLLLKFAKLTIMS